MYCKNCSEYLPYQKDFCGECGAKVIKNRLTVKGIFQEVSEEYLVSDNKLFLTFWHLLTKPEEVIDGYIGGRRKRYLNVVGYVALSVTVFGFYLFLFKNFFLEDDMLRSFSPGLNGQNPDAKLSPEQLKFASKMGSALDYMNVITVITTPLSALASYVIFITKNKHNYAEHLVLNYYMAAQVAIVTSIIFILLMVFGVSSSIAALLTLPFTLGYQAFVFKRVYKMSIFETSYKTLFFYILQMFLTMTIMGVLAVVGVLIYFWFFK